MSLFFNCQCPVARLERNGDTDGPEALLHIDFFHGLKCGPTCLSGRFSSDLEQVQVSNKFKNWIQPNNGGHLGIGKSVVQLSICSLSI